MAASLSLASQANILTASIAEFYYLVKRFEPPQINIFDSTTALWELPARPYQVRSKSLLLEEPGDFVIGAAVGAVVNVPGSRANATG